MQGQITECLTILLGCAMLGILVSQRLETYCIPSTPFSVMHPREFCNLFGVNYTRPDLTLDLYRQECRYYELVDILDDAIQIFEENGLERINETSWTIRNDSYKLEFGVGCIIVCSLNDLPFFDIHVREYPNRNLAISFQGTHSIVKDREEFREELTLKLQRLVYCNAKCFPSRVNVVITQTFNSTTSDEDIRRTLATYLNTSECTNVEYIFANDPTKTKYFLQQ